MNPESVPVRRWLWIALAVAALAVFGIRTISRQADAAKPPGASAPVLVTTAPVQVRAMPVVQSGIGTVTALQSVTVRTRVDGQIERIAYSEGRDVAAGQLLVQLDPRTFQAQLAQARAQRAKDAAQLASARADLERYTTLVAQDAATPQQLDNARALVGQLAAAVQADDAQIAYAQVQLGYTRITAPIGGRAGARLVDTGNIVHAADPGGLVVINQIDPIAVVFTLPEGGLPEIQRAIAASRAPLAVEVYPRGSREALARGRLVMLNNQIDTASGTVQLKARFDNPGHRLWPGQYVDVRLVLGIRPDAVTVPAAAVQRGAQGLYAYALGADGSAEVRPIEVAGIQDGVAVIERGLAGGDRVVVDGQYKLRAGLKAVEASAAPPRAGASR